PGEARWLAEHLRDGSDAGASATEEAGRIDELQQLVGMLADVALGPVAKGLGHARTEQGMPSCASRLSTVFSADHYEHTDSDETEIQRTDRGTSNRFGRFVCLDGTNAPCTLECRGSKFLPASRGLSEAVRG